MIGFVPLLAHALDAWQYAKSDDIEKAKIDTQHILARFEQTNDVTEVRSWLLHGPTEAPGTQVKMTFGEWSLQHKSAFIAIVEGLSAKQQDQFAQSFCESLEQSSLSAKFKTTFHDSKSKAVKAILQRLA